MNGRAKDIAAVILAAGKGTRMGSDLLKPAQSIAGKPMVRWLVEALRGIVTGPLVVVVPPDDEGARQISEAAGEGVMTVRQQEVVGTGSALRSAEKLLGRFHGDLIVTVGDSPAMCGEDFQELLQQHRQTDATITFATGVYDPPPPYGRVIRDENGALVRLLEEREATAVQRVVNEVVTSQWVFRSPLVWPLLRQIRMARMTREVLLTDVVDIGLKSGLEVRPWRSPRPDRLLGVNTPEEFAAMEEYLSRNAAHSRSKEEQGMEHVE